MASIEKRPDGRYRARWREYPGGPQRAQHFDRKSDAQRFLDRVRGDLARGDYIDPSAGRVTFREYAETWRRGQVHRPSTVVLVESHLRLHALPFFGNRPLSSIRPSEIQAWVKERSAVLAPATVQTVYRVTASVFRSAVRDRLITTTPCEQIKLPKLVRRQVVPLATEAVLRVADAMPDRYRPLVIVASGTGLRQGEVFGLEVRHIDFLGRSLRVEQQVISVSGGGKPFIGPPKTASNVRTVPLPAMDASDIGRRLLGATAPFFPRAIGDTRAVTQEELALAGLARARRLLWGMIELHESGPDLTGTFARGIYETWLNTFFLLSEGDGALEILSNNEDYARRRIARHIVDLLGDDKLALERNPATQPYIEQAEAVLAEEFDSSATRLDTQAMARRVSTWLRDHGEFGPDPMFPLRAYATLFGPESYLAVHSGIGSIKQYFEPRKDRPEQIVAGPWSSGQEDHRLLLAIAMVGSLANHVAGRLDLPADDLAAVTTTLADASSRSEPSPASGDVGEGSA